MICWLKSISYTESFPFLDFQDFFILVVICKTSIPRFLCIMWGSLLFFFGCMPLGLSFISLSEDVWCVQVVGEGGGRYPDIIQVAREGWTVGEGDDGCNLWTIRKDVLMLLILCWCCGSGIYALGIETEIMHRNPALVRTWKTTTPPKSTSFSRVILLFVKSRQKCRNRVNFLNKININQK